MPVRENLNENISEELNEDLSALNMLRETLSNAERPNIRIIESDIFIDRDDEVPVYGNNYHLQTEETPYGKFNESDFEKKCSFLTIVDDVINIDEPFYIDGITQWKSITVTFNKKAAKELMNLKNEKDFDIFIDCYENQNYLYRWVISCERILSINFNKENQIDALINVKDCVII